MIYTLNYQLTVFLKLVWETSLVPYFLNDTKSNFLS